MIDETTAVKTTKQLILESIWHAEAISGLILASMTHNGAVPPQPQDYRVFVETLSDALRERGFLRLPN